MTTLYVVSQQNILTLFRVHLKMSEEQFCEFHRSDCNFGFGTVKPLGGRIWRF